MPLQPRFTAPKRLTRTYAAGNEDAQGPGAEEAPKETMLTVNWMFDEPADIETALAFDILEHILIGNPAAPLYKALIDSGLGEALAGTGLDDGLRQPMFSIGLKGIDAADAEKVERLIIGTISGARRERASIRRRSRPRSTPSNSICARTTPARSRAASSSCCARCATWLHGRDPLSPLAFEAPLAAIKAQVAAGERYFENLIRRQFIDSQHRTVMILQAGPGAGRARDQGGRGAARQGARRP